MAEKKIKYFSRTIILLFYICGFTFFSSCASGAKSRPDDLFVYLTDTSRFILLPTGGIEKPMDMAQQISASFQDQSFFFIAWVKADESAIEMTLLNEMGANIGELSYSNESISFSSNVFPGSLKPEYIIADFQFCFYDTVLLTRALKSCGLVLKINGTTRQIFRRNNLIYEIIKNNDAVILTNHLRGYTYTLEGDFR